MVSGMVALVRYLKEEGQRGRDESEGGGWVAEEGQYHSPLQSTVYASVSDRHII